MNTVAIIQARMGSTRFPGKVLAPLAGKPVLWHVVQRLRKCRRVRQVAIATSDKPADHALAEFAQQLDVPVFRGPEDNVLARFVLAADALEPDIIVRVTGDVPLVDPGMVDRMVEALESSGAGFCTVAPGTPCIHEGIDPFTAKALRKLAGEAGDDPTAREHVTGYFKAHPDFVPIVYADVDPEFQFTGARLSVDTPADLNFMEEVYRRLGVPAAEADVRAVVRLLRANPELLAINRHVRQKAIGEVSRNVVIRCDGGRRVGLGHVVRCLALADELRERHGLGITFAVAEDELGVRMIREGGYAVRVMADEGSRGEAAWLKGVLDATAAACLVMDFRTDLERRHVEDWRKSGILIVTIDDPSDRRLAADLAFYPPVPQVKRMDWTGFTGTLHSGWEWVVLRRQFAEKRVQSSGFRVQGRNPPPSTHHHPPLLLVAMGGSDPAGLTLKAVRALELVHAPFRAIVVVGRAFCFRDELEALLATAKHACEVREDVADMAGLMADADLAVASFCVTAYELAAMGVPGIYLCLTDDHAESASAFVGAGIGISLGVHGAVSVEQVSDRIRSLLADPAERTRMSERCRRLIDGRGAERIARICVDRVAKVADYAWRQ